MKKKFLYEESQRFTQWWIWSGLGVLLFFSGKQVWNAFQLNDVKTEMWIGLGVLCAISFFFLLLKLKIQIKEEGIYLQYFPFIIGTRFISWNDISGAYVRKYNPLMEYGGWGWRIGVKGIAYNVKGNQGLQLKLKNGDELLIGTQNPEELKNVLLNLNEKKHD